MERRATTPVMRVQSEFFNEDDDWARFVRPTDGVFSSGLADANEVVDGLLVKGGVGRYRFRDIQDGQSNTFFIGEKGLNVNHLGEDGGWGDNSIITAINHLRSCEWVGMGFD